MKKFGIDVSTWQGSVNWEQVKAAGVEFAILRCGYGMDIAEQDDNTFDRNAAECERLDIPYGAYLYSYATNTARAESEANHVLRLIKDRKLEYPIYLDLEDKTVADIGSAQILENSKAFMKIIEDAGYSVGVYANLYWWNNYLSDAWYDKYPKWVAQYYTECQYEKPYGMWQYSSSGSVPGVNGHADMNFVYVDYPKIIREAGQNHLPDTVVEPTKTIDELAQEVIDGKWGNGQDRFDRLTKAGYDADAVQDRVNELLLTPKKSLDEIAIEVIRGEWGNGQERTDRLTRAGYDADAVQDRVNELMP